MPSDKLDPKQSFRRILIRNITLPLITGLVSSGIFVLLINLLMNQNKQVEHTDVVIANANMAQKLFIDGETGLRGYVITGEDKFLEPYVNSRAQAEVTLETLKNLTADNPTQTERINRLTSVYANWREYAENIIKIRADKKNVTAVVTQGYGKTMMDSSRDLFEKIIATEDRLRKERSDAVNTTTEIALVVVVVLSLIISIVLALYGRRQLMDLSNSYESVLKESEDQNARLQHQQWLKIGQSELNDQMAAQRTMHDLLRTVVQYVARYLKAEVGAFYLVTGDKILSRTATYAYTDTGVADHLKTIRFGETLVGKAALEKKSQLIKDLPGDYLKVSSATGSTRATAILIAPILDEGQVMGVIELGFLGDSEARSLDFVEMINEAIAVAINTAQYREQREKLLKEIQNQTEELQTQQEELRVTNEELEEQTRVLKNTQSRLEAQHAEMEQTNEQLEEQARTLETQKDLLDRRNDMLTEAKLTLEQKALELQRASQYKSEFLANMSHELRTPLNSSLILAKLLAENKDKNLSDQQVEFAKQISSSGNDLLNLINDILDLSKVESGKLDIHPENMNIESLMVSLKRSFGPVAQEKNLKLEFQVDPKTPSHLVSDRLRVEQILKNLLSNAIKFTSIGSVTLRLHSSVEAGATRVHFDVQDTGIGIKKEQQEIIFEAFRQADGTTNRKFGGTGLGLSISRDLAKLLGGIVTVRSAENQGSTFTLTLPQQYVAVQGSASTPETSPLSPVPAPRSETERHVRPVMKDSANFDAVSSRYFDDDRNDVNGKNDRVVLIAEDDIKFAKILYELGHEHKYKCLVTDSAEEAIELAKTYQPMAVILDMKLNGQSGLFALDQLKHSPATRHIPVHVISGQDFSRQALHLGAMGYMLKPVKREQLVEAFDKIESKIRQDIRKVLIVEDNKIQRSAIQKLIEDKTIETVAVETGAEGLQLLSENSFDCMIMDLNLPDMTGFELIEKMNADGEHSSPPVIVYTGRSLTREEELQLNRYSHSVIIKGARSPERLLDEVTLFLHGIESRLDIKKQGMLENLRNREKIFDGKSIMIVDDDMRNTFALTAALEQKGARIVIAKNGEECLQKLETEKDVDLVLMDIMMPIMDGYEATRRIRQNSKFKKLPIIALTAKAMKDDRQLCIEAGANDYLSKPVDLDKLLSLVRIWITAGWN